MKILESSKTVFILRIFLKSLYKLDGFISRAYKNSCIRRIIYNNINNISQKIVIYFRGTFWDRITGKIDNANPEFLKNSKLVHQIIIFNAKSCDRIDSYIKTSSIVSIWREFKREFSLFPLKSTGIIMVIVIMTNIFFIFLFRKEISIFGWFIRVAIFLIGIAGLFCNAGWQNVISDSRILRKIIV